MIIVSLLYFLTYIFLIILIWVFNQRLSQKILFIKLSSILRKYFISRYAFTSVHAMKKAKTRIGPQVVPHIISKLIWYLVPSWFLKSLWLYNTPCICNYQKQLQDTWTWLPPHSPSFYLLFDPSAQSNLKILTSSYYFNQSHFKQK